MLSVKVIGLNTIRKAKEGDPEAIKRLKEYNERRIKLNQPTIKLYSCAVNKRPPSHLPR